MKQHSKSIMMPLTMIVGGVFHNLFAKLGELTPYLIFMMLFITFCRISLKDMKLSAMHAWLILFQLLGAMIIYGAFYSFDNTVAQGAMICVLAPTATAAAVVAAMLGANIATMATYSLISNMAVAIAAPLIFSMVSEDISIPFWESVGVVASQVVPLLIAPFVAAMVLRKVWNRAYTAIQSKQAYSFYLWLVALAIVTGRTVHSIIEQQNADYTLEIIIALTALVICIIQFVIGRRIGRRYGDTVAGGQSLGQKNTILAIWMAQTYLLPLASLAPASYVLWQNLVNSYQLWRHNSKA